MEKYLENLKEIIELCKDEIIHNDHNANAVLDLEDLKSLNILIKKYEEILNENTKIKDLLNTQARIAEILDLPTNEKMVKFGIGYFIPKNMIINKSIDIPETLTLEYINATDLLKYRTNKEEE